MCYCHLVYNKKEKKIKKKKKVSKGKMGLFLSPTSLPAKKALGKLSYILAYLCIPIHPFATQLDFDPTMDHNLDQIVNRPKINTPTFLLLLLLLLNFLGQVLQVDV